MKPNLFIFFVSACVIIFVHYLEYIGFTPCQLCFYQRWPWYLIILLSFISIFYNNRMYKIIGQDMSFHQNSTQYTQDNLRIQFQDYSSNAFTNIVYNRIWHNGGSNMIKSYGDGYSRSVIECDMYYSPQVFTFEMDVCTGYSGSGNDVSKHPWMFMTMRNVGMFGDIGRFHAYFDKRQTHRFISKIRLYPNNYNWFGACKILVYRYDEG